MEAGSVAAYALATISEPRLLPRPVFSAPVRTISPRLSLLDLPTLFSTLLI
jgi:hypothetical protein